MVGVSQTFLDKLLGASPAQVGRLTPPETWALHGWYTPVVSHGFFIVGILGDFFTHKIPSIIRRDLP